MARPKIKVRIKLQTLRIRRHKGNPSLAISVTSLTILRPKNKWTNSSNSTSNQAPRSFSNVVGNAANQQNHQAPPPTSNSKPQSAHNRSASTNNQASHTSNGVSSPPLQTRMDTATSRHMHDRFLYLLGCLMVSFIRLFALTDPFRVTKSQ